MFHDSSVTDWEIGCYTPCAGLADNGTMRKLRKYFMFKPTPTALIFAVALALGATTAAKAGVIDVTSTIGEFDEAPNIFGPLPATTTLGNFTFSIPDPAQNLSQISGATISGTFGNTDVPGTTNVTALSDYFVNGGTMEVAACDSFSDPCAAGSESGAPVAWTYTFTQSDLSALATAFQNGSLDFSVTQNNLGAVETGPITLDIQVAPEPATIFVFSLGLAGIALPRRFRRA